MKQLLSHPIVGYFLYAVFVIQLIIFITYTIYPLIDIIKAFIYTFKNNKEQ
jgi:hypothetical protein